jgi:hypothetical protein
VSQLAREYAILVSEIWNSGQKESDKIPSTVGPLCFHFRILIEFCTHADMTADEDKEERQTRRTPMAFLWTRKLDMFPDVGVIHLGLTCAVWSQQALQLITPKVYFCSANGRKTNMAMVSRFLNGLATVADVKSSV